MHRFFLHSGFRRSAARAALAHLQCRRLSQELLDPLCQGSDEKVAQGSRPVSRRRSRRGGTTSDWRTSSRTRQRGAQSKSKGCWGSSQDQVEGARNRAEKAQACQRGRRREERGLEKASPRCQGQDVAWRWRKCGPSRERCPRRRCAGNRGGRYYIHSVFESRVFCLCAGREPSDRDPDAAPRQRTSTRGQRPTRSGLSRASSQEEEKEEETESSQGEDRRDRQFAAGGHKRWYYEQLAETTVAAGRRDFATTIAETQTVAQEELVGSCWQSASSDPYQVWEGWQALEGGEQEEKKEEKEEDQERRGWRPQQPLREQPDFEWRRRLWDVLGGVVGGVSWGSDGSAFEEEIEEATGKCATTSCGPCQAAAGPDSKGRGCAGGDRSHNRGETCQLLQHLHPSSAWSGYDADSRDAPSQQHHGLSAPWRLGTGGRPPCVTVHQSSPVSSGWQLAGGQALGDSAHGGGIGGGSEHCVEGPQACQAYGQGAGLGHGLELEEPPEGERRKRSRRFLERAGMAAAPKGKGKRRKGARQRQRLVGRFARSAKRRHEQDKGEARRERNVKDGALAWAERRSPNWMSANVGQLTVSLREALGACTSYKQTGCVLAWWMVVEERWRLSDSFTQELWGSLFEKAAARAQSRARGKGATFPLREGELSEFVATYSRLPLGDAIAPENVEAWSHQAWLFLMMCCLNRLAGHSAHLLPGRWTSSERQCTRSLHAAVTRRLAKDAQQEPMSEADWQKDVRSKRVGYSGEEITSCHVLTWAQIESSLPPEGHGGCIDALDWVGPRTRDFLLNPERLLKPVADVDLPRMPGRVHIDPHDKPKIAGELVRRNICSWLPLSQVYQVGGTKVLNGLFGVSKPSVLGDGRPVLRLIMNLTGSNSTQWQLQGGCESLPSITCWQSVVLDGNETLSLFQSDMSSAFYLFRVPKVWHPYLAFNVCVSGETIGLAPGVEFCLVCNVIPMGWLNSVGIMQEISENLLKRSPLNELNQICRGRPLPAWMNEIIKESVDIDSSWFHVYLDNFCAGERLVPDGSATRGSRCHDLAEQSWLEAGVITSAKKRVSAAQQITELGAEICGETQTLGVGMDKTLRLILGTLWLSMQRILNRKHLQIMAGRWVFQLQFRRPGMAVMQDIWKFIGGKAKITHRLKQSVRRELFMLVCLSPLWHCFLGASVAEKIVATDASETGGAVGTAETLTAEGVDFLQGAKKVEMGDGSIPSPILLISLFNGIGGCFRAYDSVGVLPMGRVAVECDAGANRITSRGWPGTEFVLDVKQVNRELVKSWSLKYLRIEEIHLWGGFPCTDLSSAKFGRLNLLGRNSILFWEIPRIKKLLQEEFGCSIVAKHAVENVASMDAEACQEISSVLGSVPYLLDCVQAVPMRRPRYAWVSEDLDGSIEGVEVHPNTYWRDVFAYADYPLTSQWLAPDRIWEGEASGACFPTCMKCIPRDKPPPKPAGLNRCDPATIQRWREDQFRYPPYQYSRQFLITSESQWRLLSTEEKELLLGYGYGHTTLAWAASKIKQQPQKFDDCRRSYLGDSFSIYSFVIVAAVLCRRFTPRLSYSHLARRLGMAPGFRAHIRSTGELARRLVYGSVSLHNGLGVLGMEQFNRMLLRKTNHTGSDIRIVTGEILKGKVFPRQSVAASWWAWKDEFNVKWKQKSHINVLALEALLLGIKHQISRFRLSDSRIFQVSDSYIAISVVSKGRSSSLQLSRVLRPIAAHLLGHGLQLILAHVESSENPTDWGSRH